MAFRMHGPHDPTVLADIAALLETPALASVKHLASTLTESVLADLPDPSVLDAAALMRKCAMIVVLAEQQGFGQAKPMAETKEEVIRNLKLHISALEEGYLTATEEVATLRDIALEQEKLIQAQTKLLEIAMAGTSLREVRLPH